MTTLLFFMMFAAAALLGGMIGAALSHPTGRWRVVLLTGLLLIPLGVGLFWGGCCLLAGSADWVAVCNRFFPDRLSKLTGCGLLLLLFCLLGLAAGGIRFGGLRPFLRQLCENPRARWLGRFLAGLGAALVLGCVLLAGDPPPTPVRLNEVCCANFTLTTAPDTGDYCDYIELYNDSDRTVDLAGYFLSDNGKKRNRFRLPTLLLEPGAYVLLWADGTGTSGVWNGTGLHLNFSLKPGDTVWFSSPHGVLLDRVTVPERHKNISLSRVGETWTQAVGTPGASNDNAVRFVPAALEAPSFSLPAGFYDAPQTLTLTAAPGCEIRYTLDGSVPGAGSLLYTGPLTLTDVSDQPNRVLNHPTTTLDRSGVITEPVDKGTVVRAVALDETGAHSEVVTAVYFVGAETFFKYRGQAVLSIVADPADLFGNYGICVTGLDYDRWLESGGVGDAPYPFFFRHGRLTERDATLHYWDDTQSLVFNEPCGIRLIGDSSRSRALKRFLLIARSIYSGSATFSSPIFGSLQTHSFFTRQDAMDVTAHRLTENRNLGGLDAIPAAVFVNGEFYYQTYLRERYDAQYFQAHYGVDPDDLIVLADSELDIGTAQDYADYQELLAMLEAADFSDPAVWTWVCERIDVENYAAFVAANLYLNNTDWSIYKNYRMWRTRSADKDGVRDGRWRWLVYDMDACYWTRPAFGGATRASYDLFSYPAPYTDQPFLELPVFRDLLRSQDFRLCFSRIWLEMMNVDFSAARLDERLLLDARTSSFWPMFLTERPDYAPALLIRALQLPGEVCQLSLTVSDTAGGVVCLGAQSPVFDGGGWTGAWVTGVPLTLTAKPAAGWHFVGWRGETDSTAVEITLSPTGDTALTAVFEPN